MLISEVLHQNDRFPSFEPKQVDPEAILHLLDAAVWAPNDGLREPWRFLFVEGKHREEALPLHRRKAPAHLVIIANAEGAMHKQAEDLAAVYCLIQNLKLLGMDNGIGIEVCIEGWIYDETVRQRLGIRNHERIAAILNIGYADIGSPSQKDQPPRLCIREC